MPEPILSTKRDFAKTVSLSPRSIDNLIARRVIPIVKLSARCVRIPITKALAALSRYEIAEHGRKEARLDGENKRGTTGEAAR